MGHPQIPAAHCCCSKQKKRGAAQWGLKNAARRKRRRALPRVLPQPPHRLAPPPSTASRQQHTTECPHPHLLISSPCHTLHPQIRDPAGCPTGTHRLQRGATKHRVAPTNLMRPEPSHSRLEPQDQTHPPARRGRPKGAVTRQRGRGDQTHAFLNNQWAAGKAHSGAAPPFLGQSI